MIKQYRLKNKTEESSEITTLQFVPEGEGIAFSPGQYIRIHLMDESGRISGQGMPYSISSAPFDPFISITVKKMGFFSQTLHNLPLGTIVGIQGPFGYFSPTSSMEEVVGLAGGIGIAPFFSILGSASSLYPYAKFTLFYSVRYEKELAGKKKLDEIEKINPKVSIFVFITREHMGQGEYKEGRISPEMLKNKIKTFQNKHYFLCGSPEFVYGMRKMLEEEEVGDTYIHTEIFF